MAGGENQTQQVVPDVVIERGVEIVLGTHLPSLELVADRLVLAVEHLAAPQPVDSAMLGGGHEPGARIVGHARRGPLLERREQRLLRQILRQPDIPAHHARETRDEPGGFDPPDRIDGRMDVGHYRPAAFRTSGGKSSISVTRRTSMTSPSSIGARLAHSMASSCDFT